MTQGAGVEHEARQLCGLHELTRGNNSESIGLTGLARWNSRAKLYGTLP